MCSHSHRVFRVLRFALLSLGVGRDAMPPVSSCADGTAYASLLSFHDSNETSTQLAGMVARSRLKKQLGIPSRYDPVDVQLRLLLVLVRSLRRVERCRRDLVLLGAHPPSMSAMWRVRLHREGVVLWPTTPILLGNPSSDKLHAWRLTQYNRILVLDTDVMVMRPLDDLFEQSADFVAAHHESDFAQSTCGIAIERRMIGAMMVLKPSLARYEALTKALSTYAKTSPQFVKKYSEQHFLACELKDVASVTRCGYLYSTHSAMSTSCRSSSGARSHEACLRAFKQTCVRHNNIISGKRERRSACEAAVQHMRTNCVGRRGRSLDIRAIHFKGSYKPWTARSKDCEKVRDGALLKLWDARNMSMTKTISGTTFATPHHSGLIPVDPVQDDVRWVPAKRLCVVVLTGSPVFWASGQPVRSERCCSFWVLSSAHWFGLLDTLRTRMFRTSAGYCLEGIAELPAEYETKPRLPITGSLYAMNRLGMESAYVNGSAGRWCCPKSCGVCRQENGCQKRPGKRWCCPKYAHMLRQTYRRPTSDFACHDPSKTGCEITLPVLPNLTEELWGF